MSREIMAVRVDAQEQRPGAARVRLHRAFVCLAELALVLLSGASFAQPVAADAGQLPTLAPMLAKVTPAVVNISVMQRDPAVQNPLLRDPIFRRFFNIPDSAAKPRESAGSGVIIDAGAGLILTNHHVLADAQEVVVTLKDRRQLHAQIVGTDPGTDISLLRVPAVKLTAVNLGDSDRLNVGDYVVAIGNPFGIGQTVTSGIVSAMARSGLGIEGYEDFVQTDASINPGNSGGALVNLRGELVGINTAILGLTGGNVGIGFAVPINMARAVADQILKYGAVRRGKLGVATDDLTPELGERYAIPGSEGALVVTVERGSEADKAGLRIKDIVLAYNGRAVRSAADLRNRIGITPVGEPVELSVLRDGQPLKLHARIGEPFAAVSIPGESVPQLSGARVADIQPGMPMHGLVQGAMVTAVDAGSPAARNGLRAGDIVIGVNRRRVRSAAECLDALRSPDRPMQLSLLRGENQMTLPLK